MNQVLLLGRLAKDPEITYSSAQEPLAITKMVLAVNQYNNKSKDKNVDFIQCVAFGKTAETLANHITKGRMISTEGHIKTGSYEKDGKKQYTTEVVIDRFFFCDFKGIAQEEKQSTT